MHTCMQTIYRIRKQWYVVHSRCPRWAKCKHLQTIISAFIMQHLLWVESEKSQHSYKFFCATIAYMRPSEHGLVFSLCHCSSHSFAHQYWAGPPTLPVQVQPFPQQIQIWHGSQMEAEEKHCLYTCKEIATGSSERVCPVLQLKSG